MQNGSFLELIQLKFVLDCEFFLGQDIVEVGKVRVVFNCPLIGLILRCSLLLNPYRLKIRWLRFGLFLLSNLFLRLVFLFFFLIHFFELFLLILRSLLDYPIDSLIELFITHFLADLDLLRPV